MEAQAWRMPALPAAIPVALLHVLLATVAVPATLLVLLAGAEPLFAASCLLLAAMAALFAAMLPRWFYLAMCFAPLAWIVLGSFALRIWGLDSLKVDVSTLFAPWQLPWLAVLATLAAAWRWRAIVRDAGTPRSRSEEHTSELQSLMRISYAVFCLKTKHSLNTQSTNT